MLKSGGNIYVYATEIHSGYERARNSVQLIKFFIQQSEILLGSYVTVRVIPYQDLKAIV